MTKLVLTASAIELKKKRKPISRTVCGVFCFLSEGRFTAHKQIIFFDNFFLSLYQEFFLCYFLTLASCMRHLHLQQRSVTFPRRVAQRSPQNADHAKCRHCRLCIPSTFFEQLTHFFSILRFQSSVHRLLFIHRPQNSTSDC